jgi:hypothetical protein
MLSSKLLKVHKLENFFGSNFEFFTINAFNIWLLHNCNFAGVRQQGAVPLPP